MPYDDHILFNHMCILKKRKTTGMPKTGLLIGKNKNDLVEISTPAGIKNFEIKDVKYV